MDKPSTPEKRAEMAKLLDKYAPVFKLAYVTALGCG